MLASRKSERLGGSLGGGSVVAPPSTSSNEDFFGRTIDTRVLIAMVGLPARGKSFVAHKLVNFLNWRCIPAKIFNVGNHRRKQADGVRQDANFFDVNNSDALKMRENLATEVLKDAVDQLLNGSLIVAVFDATNTTRSRRDKIRHFVEQNQSDKRILQLIFIESICNDAEVIAANFDVKWMLLDFRFFSSNFFLIFSFVFMYVYIYTFFLLNSKKFAIVQIIAV